MAVANSNTQEEVMDGSDDSLIAPDQHICLSADEYIECLVESPNRQTEENCSQKNVEYEVAESTKLEILSPGHEELSAKQEERSSAEKEIINVEDSSDGAEKLDHSFSDVSNMFIRDNGNLDELRSQEAEDEEYGSLTPSKVNTPIRVEDFLGDSDYGTSSKFHPSATERWSSEKVEKLLNLARGFSNVVKCCVCQAVSSSRKRHLLHVSKHYLTMKCVCGFSDKKRDVVTLHQKKTGHPRIVYEVSDDCLEDWQKKVMKPDITGFTSHDKSVTTVLSKKPTTKSAKSAAFTKFQNEWIGKDVHRLIKQALGPKKSLRCGKCFHRSNTHSAHYDHVRQHYLSYKCECSYSNKWRKSVVSHQMTSGHTRQVYTVSHAMESKWASWINKNKSNLTGATVDEWGPWVSDAVKEKIVNDRGKPGCLTCGCCGEKSLKTQDHFRHVDQHHVLYRCVCGKSTSKYKQSVRRHQNLTKHASIIYVVSNDKTDEFEKVVVDNKQSKLATNKLAEKPDTRNVKISDTRINPTTERWVSETIKNQIAIARGTNTLTCGICEHVSKSCVSHFFHVDMHFLTWRCECGFKSETSRKCIVKHLARTEHPPVIYAVSQDQTDLWEDTVMSCSPYKSKKSLSSLLSEEKHGNYLQQNGLAIDSSINSVAALKLEDFAGDSQHGNEQTGDGAANVDDKMSLSKIPSSENWVSDMAMQAISKAIGSTGVLKCGVCQLISSSAEKHQEHARTHYITYRCECNYASAYIGCTRRHQRKSNHDQMVYILSEDQISSWEKERNIGKKKNCESWKVNATSSCSVVLDPLLVSAIRKRKRSEQSESTEDEMDGKPETSHVSNVVTNSKGEEYSAKLKKKKRWRRMLMDLQKQLCQVQTTVNALLREEESDME